MPRQVRLSLHLGAPRNTWCDGCMTSARIEVDVLHLADEGVSVMATASKCPRCDA